MYSIKISHADLKEIINRHDPEGLIELGASKDEYGSEIRSVYDTISQNDLNDLLVPGKLEETIVKIFNHYFATRNIEPWLPRYKALANELVEKLAEIENKSGTD